MGRVDAIELVQFNDIGKQRKKIMWLSAGFVVVAIVASFVFWAPSSSTSTTLSSKPLETSVSSSQKTVGTIQPNGKEVPALSINPNLKQDETQSGSTSETSPSQARPSVSSEQSLSVTSTEGFSASSEAQINPTTTKRPETTKAVITTVVSTTANLPPPSASALNELRSCLTGGDYSTDGGNDNAYGAYYFVQSTWNDMAEASGRTDLLDIRPDAASPQDQDAMALELYKWGYARTAWPNCGPLLYE